MINIYEYLVNTNTKESYTVNKEEDELFGNITRSIFNKPKTARVKWGQLYLKSKLNIGNNEVFVNLIKDLNKYYNKIPLLDGNENVRVLSKYICDIPEEIVKKYWKNK